MKQTKELIEIINKHPDHKLIFFYPDEGSGYSNTLGYPTQILVDEYWIDDERAWLRKEDEIEMKEYYGENIADDLFEDFPLTEKQEEYVDKKLEEFINSKDWKKCICVYISY